MLQSQPNKKKVDGMLHPILHFRTITRHRHAVIRHCRRAGIFWQGLRHDLSKYAPQEFLTGARHYAGNRSPNVNERMAYGFSKAWMHHKGRNKHHFEYWTDYSLAARRVMPVKMPLRYVAEMFCDRVAASKIYRAAAYNDRDALLYFESGRDCRSMHPETSRLLEAWLRMLAERGERETFACIRRMVRRAKRDGQTKY